MEAIELRVLTNFFYPPIFFNMVAMGVGNAASAQE